MTVSSPLRVDIIIPSYNRAEKLRKTLRSLLRYPVPESLDVQILVVNNNSPDHSAQMLNQMTQEARGRLRVVLETKAGSSHARNAGIAASKGEILAFLDDDEEITSTWYPALAEVFADPTIHYVGGPMLPNWRVNPPEWLPVWEFNGVLSIFEGPPTPADYGPGFPYLLVSGNCAFRRTVFDQVGLYRPDLGRIHEGLGGSEDDDLCLRLIASGLRGRYVPSLAILHNISGERLTASYYRRWIAEQSISQARMGRCEDVVYWMGVPRYQFGNLARKTLELLQSVMTCRLTRKQLFMFELYCRQLGGLLYGSLVANKHMREK